MMDLDIHLHQVVAQENDRADGKHPEISSHAKDCGFIPELDVVGENLLEVPAKHGSPRIARRLLAQVRQKPQPAPGMVVKLSVADTPPRRICKGSGSFPERFRALFFSIRQRAGDQPQLTEQRYLEIAFPITPAAAIALYWTPQAAKPINQAPSNSTHIVPAIRTLALQ